MTIKKKSSSSAALQQGLVLPVRSKNEGVASQEDPHVSIHPLPSKDGVIVKVRPPQAPPSSGRVPCDIVLVIDVSSSMNADAPVPTLPGETAESNGLTVLDLVKHASRTILETLDDNDRLGIVTFSCQATIVQKLEPMNEENKKLADKNIERMKPRGMTNLWHGLRDGLSLFGKAVSGKRTASMMVLTDGQPNHMCPAQGYVPKLREMGSLPTSIYTFGFGYSLRSGLLKSIAEIGHGNYAFIPDAGMIGTVFVHSVANLQAAWRTNASLDIVYPPTLGLETTTGRSVEQQAPTEREDGRKELRIPLGNIQFGQPREVYLRYTSTPGLQEVFAPSCDAAKVPAVSAVLTHQGSSEACGDEQIATAAPRSIVDFAGDLSKAEVAFHVSRSEICAFLESFIPVQGAEEHEARPLAAEDDEELARLVEAVRRRAGDGDPLNTALLKDLEGEEPHGQIAKAIANKDDYLRWGRHYIPSLLNAHQRQMCNSFKDPGPLLYGRDSPLFTRCRDALDNAFDNLPPPKPSKPEMVDSQVPISSMRAYHNVDNPCFAAGAQVQLSSGETVRVSRLRKGTAVRTPVGGVRRVAAVLKTPVCMERMCRVGELLVTPWHPISLDGSSWVFPAEVADSVTWYSGAIFSVLLEKDRDADAHAVMVDGVWGVTLGHGVLSGQDARAHSFFGDYDLVSKSLSNLGAGQRGVVVGGGVMRDAKTGMVSGFDHPLKQSATG